MTWERILQKDQLELIVDTEKHLMLETSSGGAVPRYVTVHIQSKEEINELIAALNKAKEFLI
ncbi:MAG: hypothetical protein JWM44_2285 [Bacilli bacterium]|jgi:hypothetical protein|nr:hypothetical protein [Bacilli bacterium]